MAVTPKETLHLVWKEELILDEHKNVLERDSYHSEKLARRYIYHFSDLTR